MKKYKNLIIALIIISLTLTLVIIYLFRNNSYKGAIYYIKKIQLENSFHYTGTIPNPKVIKTINYNKNMKIVFWEDSKIGVSFVVLEHFDRKWFYIGGSGIGGVYFNNLLCISYQPVNFKSPPIYIWETISNSNLSKITLNNVTLNKIPLSTDKSIFYNITTKNPAISTNFLPCVKIYKKNKLIKKVLSCTF